jgi:2-oxo-4-hydroxy-4-carboxy--5-ureidoimidazoline (OHCU) decarboxylase
MTEMTELDRAKMLVAIDTMQEVCAKYKTCFGCPFIFCEDNTQPQTWILHKKDKQREKEEN